MNSQNRTDIHESQASTIITVIVIFPVIATILVLLRLYTRFILISRPSLDDLLITFALAFTVTTSIFMGVEVKNGMGQHMRTLSQVQIRSCFKALFLSIIAYNLSLVAIKLSILFQYLRVSISIAERRACYGLIGFLIAYGIMTFFTGIFTCSPVEYFWDRSIPGGICVDKTKLYYANAGLNIASDLILLLLPVLLLRHLTLPLLQRLVVIVILAFGGFACIASILRLRVLYVSTVSKDLTWDKAPTVTWSAIELSMGIFCACIPTLRPLACHLFPKAFKPQRCARVSAGYRKEFPTARMKAKAEPEDITLTSYVEVSSTKDNAPVDPESAPVAGDSITQASEGSVTIYE